MAKIEISGNAISIINVSLEKLKNIRPFLQRATLYQERSTKLNFQRQSDPDGNRWSPLRPSTLRSKRSGAILRETSNLINSISSSVGSNEGIVRAGAAYGIFHQAGTRKMVRRQFLGIGAKDVDRITQIAVEMFSP